jgi:hypothetical protein
MPGLLDKLTNDGSILSYDNGQTPVTNPGATQQSKLHANGNQAGYSLNGSEFNDVNAAYQSYKDGYNNALPMPTQLDLNGQRPQSYSNTGPTEGHY